MKRKPPQWQRFDRWVVFGALVGLGVALGVFCTVHFVLYGNFAFIKNMRGMAGTADIGPSDMLTMTATVLGGLTIGGAAVMQYRKHKWNEYQAKMDEDSRTGERLGKAIEHLGDGELYIRLGAIHEFERLEEDSQRDRERIAWILFRFIKDRTKNESKDDPLALDVEMAAWALDGLVRKELEEMRPKVRAVPHEFVLSAAKLLSSDSVTRTHHKNGMPLKGLQAKYLDLSGIHLEKANLSGASLEGTNFTGANIEGANLVDAHLEDANLSRAYLEGADIKRAHLENTKLRFAHLEDADFSRAYLEGADLTGAHLKNARFCSARLENADFASAQLEGADFRRADLQSASFDGAFILASLTEDKDANIIRGKLSERKKTNLQGADFRGACFDEKTSFGESFMKAEIDDQTLFDPREREKYFPEFGKEKETGAED